MDFQQHCNKKQKMIMTLSLIIVLKIVDADPEIGCNRIKIGDHWYDREIFWSTLGRPYNLNAHRSSNIVFFSYSVPETYSAVDFQLGYYNLDTEDYRPIVGIKGGCSVAIDQMNDDIYLGGSDGIYKYNMLTNVADFYQEKGKNIWSLFVKNNLFYISYPDQKLYMQYNGKFAKVKEFESTEVDHFHITVDNIIYYANKSGLFKYNTDAMTPETVSEVLLVRQIAEDNEGDIYMCTNIGVFTDGKYDGLKKVLDLKNIYGLTFDRDNNLLYSDGNNIVRLKYSVTGCDQTRPSY